MATMKEIAQICGVSRGTVDRVINRRGKVRPETERMILQAVERMGYTKSMLGRALSVKRSQPAIGVVLCSEGNPFFDDVYAGLARAEEELLPYGVTVERRAMRGYDVDRQLALIDELSPSLSALVLQPVNDPRVEARVKRLKVRGVPTVTVNTDLPASSRCCYVGSDYESGGATAAALLELITQGRGRVGVVAGVPTLMGHVARLRGFRKRLARCSELPVVAVENSLDDPARAYAVTRDMLRSHPEIDAMFVVTAGCEGVCRALISAGRAGEIRVVGYDDVPATREMMRLGIVRAVVCQQPFEQGYRSLRAAFDMVLSGEMMDDRRIIMENQIKLLENLSPAPQDLPFQD